MDIEKVTYCIYVFCEKKQELTKRKHKCRTLYVGETVDFKKRMDIYLRKDESKPVCFSSNDLLAKLNNYLFRINKPLLSSVPFNKIEKRLYTFPKLKDDDYRKEVEGYLINRLNPLLNRTKKEGKFELNYKKFKNIKNELTFEDYEEDCRESFSYWYQNRRDIGGTETIYNVKLRKQVNRYSWLGEQAMERNFDKKYNTWFWKTNELQFKFDLWKTNYDKWLNNLKYR